MKKALLIIGLVALFLAPSIIPVSADSNSAVQTTDWNRTNVRKVHINGTVDMGSEVEFFLMVGMELILWNDPGTDVTIEYLTSSGEEDTLVLSETDYKSVYAWGWFCIHHSIPKKVRSHPRYWEIDATLYFGVIDTRIET